MDDVTIRAESEEPGLQSPRPPQVKHAESAPPTYRITFAQKVILLMTVLIFLTGISITSVIAFYFRAEMYQREYSTAFTVYAAAANYLAGHYRSNDDEYIPRSIDFVLRNKFLRLSSKQDAMITHRPSRLTLYDERGRVVYDYKTSSDVLPAQNLHPSLIPLSYGPLYYPKEQEIRVARPVAPDERIPGYVEISFPSSIQAKVKQLFKKAFLIMGGVVLIAAGLSWIFARNVLAPIEALTRAARRMHRGDFDQEVHVSSDDEIGVLASTFNEMAASIARRIALLHRIQEWTVRIGKELESQRLYGTLVAMFSLMSTSHVCRLYVYDPEDDRLVLGFERGGDHLPPLEDDHLAHRALEQRWAQYLDEGGTITEDNTQAMEIAIPLFSGEHRIGVIRIGRTHDETPYNDETLTILQTLAQHASVAADNAHLYEQLAEKERIEQEMKWARRIQQAMLPHETPSLRGYEIAGESMPAYEVGGDYFDYIATDGRKWYFVIADVSGKGVPAALVMSIVRSLLRTYVDFEKSPHDILRNVNRKLCTSLEPEMFVTITVLSLDPDTNEMHVARGGHEPLLLMRSGGKLEEIEPAGAALGILDVDAFDQGAEQTVTHLKVGDLAVLYTDGVTEARNMDDEEFGLERLEALIAEHAGLTAGEMLAKIRDDVQQFATGRTQHDDITLVVFKRTGSP